MDNVHRHKRSALEGSRGEKRKRRERERKVGKLHVVSQRERSESRDGEIKRREGFKSSGLIICLGQDVVRFDGKTTRSREQQEANEGRVKSREAPHSSARAKTQTSFSTCKQDTSWPCCSYIRSQQAMKMNSRAPTAETSVLQNKSQCVFNNRDTQEARGRGEIPGFIIKVDNFKAELC